jgi:hypothetical protein
VLDAHGWSLPPQVGVVAVGQPLPLWARQAAVKLLVMGVVPEGLQVARLAPGTEVHIAPKLRPREGGDAAGGAPQSVLADPRGPAGACAGPAQAATADSEDAAPPRCAWLRVLDAPADCLLHTAQLAEEQGAGPPAAISSWLTTAAAMSQQTACDQGLTLGRPAQLFSSDAGSGAVAPGGAGATPPPQYAVQLLRDDTVPWGHAALAPPLQAALGLGPREYVKLEQAGGGRPPAPQLLGRCPPLELRLLLPEEQVAAAAAAAAADVGGAGGDAAAAAGSGGAATPSGPRGRGRGREGSGGGGPGAWAAGLVSNLQGALAGGLPELGGLLAGAAGLLLPPGEAQQGAAAPHAGRRGHSAGGGGAAGAAKAGGGGGGGTADGALAATAATAVDAWLRLQLAALVARAAVGRGLAPAVARAAKQQPDGMAPAAAATYDDADAGALPLTGPLLVHFQLPQGAAGLLQGAGRPSGGSAAATEGAEQGSQGGGGQPHDFSMVLFPQLPASFQAPPPAWCALPPAALAGALAGPAGLPRVTLGQPLLGGAAPPAAARRGGPLAAPSDALQPAAFEWLALPLAAAARRLAPRLGLRRWLALRRAGLPLAGGPLVCGGGGSGKTALLHLLGAALQRGGGTSPGAGGAPRCNGAGAAPPAPAAAPPPPAPVHVVIVSCRDLAGARFERAAGAIGAAAAEALARCPGAVLLDDLDQLCPVPGDGPEQAAHDGETAARLAEWLADLMRWAASQARPLAFVATARDAAALPPGLRQAGCLDCEVRLPAPGASGRAAMMLRDLRERGCEPEGAGGDQPGGAGAAATTPALLRVSEKADGFDAKDIGMVVDRALHIALRRQLGSGAGGRGGGGCCGGASGGGGGGGVRVTAADLEAALEGFVPAAFRGVGRRAGARAGGGAGPEGWADVGGLSEAKAALVEVLELPLKWVGAAGPAAWLGCCLAGLLRRRRLLRCVAAGGQAFVAHASPDRLPLPGPSSQVARPRRRRAAAPAHGAAAVRPPRLRQDAHRGRGRRGRGRAPGDRQGVAAGPALDTAGAGASRRGASRRSCRLLLPTRPSAHVPRVPHPPSPAPPPRAPSC